jgi:hypothetical protein
MMPFPIRYPTPPDPAPIAAPVPATPATPRPVAAPPPQSTPARPGAMNQILTMLPALLGGMAPRGGSAFMRGMQRAQQEQIQQQQIQWQAADREQAMAIRQQQLELQQRAAEAKAQQDRVQAYQSIVARLSDPSVSSPEAYDAAEAEMVALAPLLGVEPGAVVAMRSRFRTTNRFEQAAAARVLKQAEKYIGESASQVAQDDPLFTENGVQKPLSAWMAIAGQSLPRRKDGSVYTPTTRPRVDVPNTPEEQFYQRFAEERGAPSFVALPTAQQAAARRQWMQSDDRPTGSDGLSAVQRFTMQERLASSWEKASTTTREMDRQLRVMNVGLTRYKNGDRNGGSQAILVTFQKILDPTSVVRESEYARTTDGQSFLNRIEGYADRLARGGVTLTEPELTAMVQTARDMLSSMATWTAGRRARIARVAAENGLRPELVFDDVLSGADTTQETPDARARRLYDELTRGAK